VTALAKRRVLADGMPRYTTYFAKTSPVRTGMPGYDWSITDERTGLVVRHGWVAGSKRDAAAEARVAIKDLKS
jgi:hypothetical protein